MGNANAKKTFSTLDADRTGKLTLDQLLLISDLPGVSNGRLVAVTRNPLFLFSFDQSGEGSLNYAEFEKLLGVLRGYQSRIDAVSTSSGGDSAHPSGQPVSAAISVRSASVGATPVASSVSPKSAGSHGAVSVLLTRDDSAACSTFLAGSPLGSSLAAPSGPRAPSPDLLDDDEAALDALLRDESTRLAIQIFGSREHRTKFLDWLFRLADVDQSKRVNVAELAELLSLLQASGLSVDQLLVMGDEESTTDEAKLASLSLTEAAQLLLDEYDTHRTGYLSQDEFSVLARLISRSLALIAERAATPKASAHLSKAESDSPSSQLPRSMSIPMSRASPTHAASARSLTSSTAPATAAPSLGASPAVSRRSADGGGNSQARARSLSSDGEGEDERPNVLASASMGGSIRQADGTGAVEAVGGFVLGRRLGSGAAGPVFLGTSASTGEQRAIKVVPRSKQVAAIAELEREVRAMLKLSHPRVVQLHGVFETGSHVYLVMELADGGSLEDYVSDVGPVPEAQVRFVARQLFDTLAFAHSCGVCHRDLKLQNLLLSANGDLKLADFGHAGLYSEGWDMFATGAVGSLWHVAPEQLNGQVYSGEKLDAWSAVVCLYRLTSGGLPPFCASEKLGGSTPQAYIAAVRTCTWLPRPQFSPAFAALVGRTLVADTAQRPSVSQLAADGWTTTEPVEPPPLAEADLEVPTAEPPRAAFAACTRLMSRKAGAVALEKPQMDVPAGRLAFAKCVAPRTGLKFTVALVAAGDGVDGQHLLQVRLRSGSAKVFRDVVHNVRSLLPDATREERERVVASAGPPGLPGAPTSSALSTAMYAVSHLSAAEKVQLMAVLHDDLLRGPQSAESARTVSEGPSELLLPPSEVPLVRSATSPDLLAPIESVNHEEDVSPASAGAGDDEPSASNAKVAVDGSDEAHKSSSSSSTSKRSAQHHHHRHHHHHRRHHKSARPKDEAGIGR